MYSQRSTFPGEEDASSSQAETPEREKPIHKNPKQSAAQVAQGVADISTQIAESDTARADYEFPPVSLLKKGDPRAVGDSREHLQEMSARLQMTLTNFGVRAHVTNVTCGPR